MSTPFKMKGFSGFGSSPVKKSSSDDKYAYDKGSKFVDEEKKVYEGGSVKIKHSGGFGVIIGGTNAKGYTRKENEFLTGAFAEKMRRDGFTNSEINAFWEARGVEGPHNE